MSYIIDYDYEKLSSIDKDLLFDFNSKYYYNDAFNIVSKNGIALKFVSEPTSEICIAAVKNNGLALQYVKQQTLDICLIAIKQNINAKAFVTDKTLLSNLSFNL